MEKAKGNDTIVETKLWTILSLISNELYNYMYANVYVNIIKCQIDFIVGFKIDKFSCIFQIGKCGL